MQDGKQFDGVQDDEYGQKNNPTKSEVANEEEEEEENNGEKDEDNLMDVEEDEEERNQAERADCKGVDNQHVQVEKEDDKTDESEAPQIFAQVNLRNTVNIGFCDYG